MYFFEEINLTMHKNNADYCPSPTPVYLKVPIHISFVHFFSLLCNLIFEIILVIVVNVKIKFNQKNLTPELFIDLFEEFLLLAFWPGTCTIKLFTAVIVAVW
jgi:hypothetical protein